MSGARKAGKEWTVPSELSFASGWAAALLGLCASVWDSASVTVTGSQAPHPRSLDPARISNCPRPPNTDRKGDKEQHRIKNQCLLSKTGKALFLPWLRARVHRRPDKEASHGSSQSGFLLGGILGVRATSFKLLSPSASGKGAANALRQPQHWGQFGCRAIGSSAPHFLLTSLPGHLVLPSESHLVASGKRPRLCL